MTFIIFWQLISHFMWLWHFILFSTIFIFHVGNVWKKYFKESGRQKAENTSGEHLVRRLQAMIFVFNCCSSSSTLIILKTHLLLHIRVVLQRSYLWQQFKFSHSTKSPSVHPLFRSAWKGGIFVVFSAAMIVLV